MSDLVVLAACKDIQAAVQGILAQHRRVGIRPVTSRVQVFASGHDAGCYQKAPEILRSQLGQFEHALVVFDHDGSGAETVSPEDVELELGRRLAQVGWGDRAAAVVIAPEVEVWAFSDSPHVEAALGWRGREPGLWPWLVAEGLVERRGVKPSDPKKALNAALRLARCAHSPSVFAAIAKTISFDRCSDRSFARLLGILRRWFGVSVSEDGQAADR